VCYEGFFIIKGGKYMKKSKLSFYLVITALMLLINLHACQLLPKKQAEKPVDPPKTIISDRFLLKVGSKQITVNNEPFELNAPVIELEGMSYLPLRFFLDYFQATQIEYNAPTEEISFTLTRNQEMSNEFKQSYQASSKNPNEKHDSSVDENYETYKSMYIQSMTESYKGTANFDFDQKKKAFILKPENELLGLIMLAIDGNQAKIDSWTEFVNTLVVLSNTIKSNMPEHSIIVINPSDPSIVFLHVKDGEILWDVLNN
jgi:hypothetical protein